ncbi:hypothetical protein Z945_3801 [Sulfitobacter noctilucae]|uniref:hypothetical protein n=1 Tax=Sulfitobacter noctilucae TaxID=1342302 RepID=UPI00046940FB|nr:hypothetical protein [Sulfitobacter noctilucae]KIN69909.1 hypothetical protein Z945_3801 [Sulfitobacter noctilucae]
MKSYAPKILTFTPSKKFSYQDMEDQIAKYTLNGWKIISMTHFQGYQPVYTVLLQYEFSEQEMQENAENRA